MWNLQIQADAIQMGPYLCRPYAAKAKLVNCIY